MQVVRLYDPSRRPANWTDVIRPGQFAVFAADTVSGAACDLNGVRFTPAEAATCAITDSLDEARHACEAAVRAHPALRLDVFDSEGRARPPLLTVLHPDRAGALEESAPQVRRRRAIAWTLIGVGVPLLVYAALAPRERETILPAFLGLNMILFGGRILWLNLALRETERVRQARLAAVSGESAAASPDSADPTRPSRRSTPR